MIKEYTITNRVEAKDPVDPPLPGHFILMGDMVWFICPCGCGKDCFLKVKFQDTPTLGNRPIWFFSEKDNKPTLSPSVQWTSGCLSHFFIEDGKVRWLNG